MDGWIKLHRKIADNTLWTCEPFTRGQAWVDLLMLANFEQGYLYVRGVKVIIERGQIGWSEPKLADRWRWSRTKVRKFLNDLEKEQQIIQQKDNITQVLTIINYEEYQNKEQQKNSRKTAEEQQKDAKKKNKEKEEENINVLPPKRAAAHIPISTKFYNEAISADCTKDYQLICRFILGDNSLGKPLKKVLSLPEQLSEKQFQTLREKAEPKGKKIMQMLLDCEGKDSYTKGRESLYLILNSWLNHTK